LKGQIVGKDKETKKPEAAPVFKTANTQAVAFIIDAADPCIDGVQRFHTKLSGKAMPRNDNGAMVLYADDPATPATLENYAIRSAGRGATDAAKTARDASARLSVKKDK
jgi:hypothetical protein